MGDGKGLMMEVEVAMGIYEGFGSCTIMGALFGLEARAWGVAI